MSASCGQLSFLELLVPTRTERKRLYVKSVHTRKQRAKIFENEMMA